MDDLETDHQDVIYHTEVRWLSKGKMLERVYELLQEIKEFMQMKSKDMPQLEDQDWLRDFAFLVDITGHLNILNTQLQGRGHLVNVMFGNIKAFQNKLMLWIQQLSNGNSSNFTKLTEQGLGNHGSYFAEQLRQLLVQFKERFVEFKEHELELDLFSTPYILTLRGQ